MARLRVLVVDDHRLIRQGIAAVCRTVGGFDVVGEAENGLEAVELALQLRPDVVLMDLRMPIMNGLEATAHIVHEQPSAVVLALTVERADRYVYEAIRAGARGYLVKTIDADQLVAAVEAAHRGEPVINADLAAKVIEAFRARDGVAETLTEGEQAVLRLVAAGRDNAEICRTLGLAPSTVSNRLSVIFQKLHVSSRTQAALEALRRGWASIDDDPPPA